MRGHRLRHTEKAGDDHDRHRFGERLDEIGFSIGRKPIDQVISQALDARLQARDLPREERGIDEAAQAGVHWGLQLEQGMLFKGVKRTQVRRRFRPAEFLARRHVENLPSESPFALQRADVLVAGEAPVSELLPKKDGAFLAPARVERVGVLHELGLARIERNRAGSGGHRGKLSAAPVGCNAD